MAIRGTADEVSGAVIATAVDAASPLVKDDRRSAAQRRLDGLTEICQRFLASADARDGHVGVARDALRRRAGDVAHPGQHRAG